MLDVKLRSSVVRAARTRLVAFALGGAFAAIFGLYVLWRVGDWGLNRLLYENKTFAIREIEVQTDGVLSLDQLRRWAGVTPGANLLALDLAGVKRNLEYVPFIASASVERVLPGMLRVRVRERQPVAQVNLPRPRPGGGVEVLVYHLDAEGSVMTPLDSRQRSTPIFQEGGPLPAVSGVNPHDLHPGRRIESPAVQSALQFILAFDRSPMAGLVELHRIDAGASGVLVATTAQGSEVTIGLHDFARQLLRWREIHDAGTRLQQTIATLDLAVTNNIPVRWVDNRFTPPSPAPPPAKSSRPARKHV